MSVVKHETTARRPKRARSLAEYRAKRRFDSTPEPRGDTKAQGHDSELIFCVQKHLASHLHYDFRLEHRGVLLSWAVPKGPSLNPRDRRLAMQTEDHPLDYGDFEGVIPSGYGAGIVMLWDSGHWQPLGSPDIDAALRRGKLDFELEGYKLKGAWTLIRTRGDGKEDGRSWILIKRRDHWSGELDVTTAAPLSIKTDRDFAEILAREPEIWESHRPARGGETGQMFERIIRRAAQLRVQASEPPRRLRRA